MNQTTPPPIDDETPVPPVGTTQAPVGSEAGPLLYQPCEKPEKPEPSLPSTPTFLANIRQSFWEN